MTPEQAIEVLLKAASMAHLPKQDHIICEQASKVLKDLLAKINPQAQESGKVLEVAPAQ